MDVHLACVTGAALLHELGAVVEHSAIVVSVREIEGFAQEKARRAIHL